MTASLSALAVVSQRRIAAALGTTFQVHSCARAHRMRTAMASVSKPSNTRAGTVEANSFHWYSGNTAWSKFVFHTRRASEHKRANALICSLLLCALVDERERRWRLSHTVATVLYEGPTHVYVCVWEAAYFEAHESHQAKSSHTAHMSMQ